MKRAAIAWSFGKKKKDGDFVERERAQTPGPGYYLDESMTKQSAKAGYSFNKNPKRMTIKNTNPGPGYYLKSTDNLFGKHTPKYTLSKTDRNKHMALNTSVGSSLTAIATKRPSTPGPGYYSSEISTLKATKKKSQGFKIGTSKKEIDYNNHTPGPGHYNDEKNTIKSKTPQWSLGKSQRWDPLLTAKMDIGKNEPGPGMYNINNTTSGKGITIKGKETYTPKNITPGPGSYQNDKTKILKKNPGWKIGTSTRDKIFSHNEDIPGPGYYNTPTVSRNHQGFKFTNEKKLKSSKANEPGPGQYYIPCSIVNVPHYTTGQFDKNFKFV